MLTSTVSAPLYGKLSDMYGRKQFFAISICIFLVASALCAAAQSMTAPIAFRALQGLGAGGLMTMSQTLVGSIVPMCERGRYQGLFTGAFAVSSVAGPLLGGFITSHASWRWVFYVNVPIGALSLALALTSRPKVARGSTHVVDYAGAVLVCVGTSALLLLLNSNSAAFMSGVRMPALLLLAVVCFVALLKVERRAREPIIDLQLFANVPFATCVAASGIMAFAMMGSLIFTPLYYQLVLHETPEQSGAMMLPQVAMMLITSVAGGRFSVGICRIAILLCVGVGLECVGLVLLSVMAHRGTGVVPFLFAMAVLGAGMGIGMPNATVIVQNSVPERLLGSATATMSFVRSLGGSLGVALSGGIMTLVLRHRLADLARSFDVQALLDHGMTAIAQMSASQQALVVGIYREAIGATLVAGGVLMFVGFLLVGSLALRRS